MTVIHNCIECGNKMNVIIEEGKNAQLAACLNCGRIQKAQSVKVEPMEHGRYAV